MREVLVEFTMMLPSKEHIDIYENLAEDGVLGEYFQNLFLQACSAAQKQSDGQSNKEDIDSIKRQLEALTSAITTLTSNGVVNSLPAIPGVTSEASQQPAPKPKTTPKKKITKSGGGKAKGNFMANAMAKSKAINATRRDG